MKHLDERVSDLVDDRLDHDERDRALAHLTGCAACREAVEFERHARNAVRSLSDVAPSEKLVRNLLALAEPGEPLPPAPPPGSAAPASVASWLPRESWFGGHPGAGNAGFSLTPRSAAARRTRAAKVLALGMCSTGATLVLLASLGSPPETADTPATPASVVPPVEEFAVEHARTTGGLPFVEPASLLVSDNSGVSGNGW